MAMKRSDAGEIFDYLDTHGTIDKDAKATQSPRKKPRFEAKPRGGRRMTLDLHGRTAVESVSMIRQAFDSCETHAVFEMLVIHGKGRHSPRSEGPVLKRLVYDMLENELALRVKDFRTAVPRDGGEGATLVILRQTSGQRS
jgi:DNA-nicking Smr family endonuclease